MVAHVIIESPQVPWLGFGLLDFGLGLDNKDILILEDQQHKSINDFYSMKIEDLGVLTLLEQILSRNDTEGVKQQLCRG